MIGSKVTLKNVNLKSLNIFWYRSTCETSTHEFERNVRHLHNVELSHRRGYQQMHGHADTFEHR